MEPVLVTCRDAVATITLNHPERRNSLTNEMKSELRKVLDELATDRAVRALTLTGSGGHFCAGQDLVEHAEALERDGAHAFDAATDQYVSVIETLTRMPKPVIGAVEGSCVGAGLALALACDLLVLAENTRFATAFTSVGLTCDSGLSHTLSRTFGASRARRLVLLGESFSATESVEWGVAATITTSGQALPTAVDIASELALGPTAAYAESKRLLADTWGRDLNSSLLAEGVALQELGASVDHRTAVRAFVAKQKPTFIGR